MKKNAVMVMMLFVVYSLSPAVEAPTTEAVAKNDSAAPATVQKDSITPVSAKKEAGAQTGFARLSLRSQPDSAAIVIDSSDKGQTPAVIDSLSPGPHVVLIKKKGYFVKKITTTLHPDSLHDISVTLIRPGCIVVRSEPAGAALFLDNKEAGTTPYENAKLKPGNYTVRLALENHETVERPMTVAETGCDTLSITLPLSKAYTDSVDRAQKAVAEKKRKFKKTVDLIAVGAFLVFGAVIFLIEAGSAD